MEGFMVVQDFDNEEVTIKKFIRDERFYTIKFSFLSKVGNIEFFKPIFITDNINRVTMFQSVGSGDCILSTGKDDPRFSGTVGSSEVDVVSNEDNIVPVEDKYVYENLTRDLFILQDIFKDAQHQIVFLCKGKPILTVTDEMKEEINNILEFYKSEESVTV